MLTSFEVIPDHTITKHLGLINLFIIRETTALYEVSFLLGHSSIGHSNITYVICQSTSNYLPTALINIPVFAFSSVTPCLFYLLVAVLTLSALSLLSTIPFVTDSTCVCTTINPHVTDVTMTYMSLVSS